MKTTMRRAVREMPGPNERGALKLRFLGRLAVPVLAACLASAAAGCGTAPPGAGITNPNPGSVNAGDKPADRVDMNVPDRTTSRDEPLIEAASSGAGGVSGETPTPAPPATAPAGSPPKKENSGNAQGAAKPDDSTKTGTPRSPQ